MISLHSNVRENYFRRHTYINSSILALAFAPLKMPEPEPKTENNEEKKCNSNRINKEKKVFIITFDVTFGKQRVAYAS